MGISILGSGIAWLTWIFLWVIILTAAILLFRATEAVMGIRQEMMLRRMARVTRQANQPPAEPIRAVRQYRVTLNVRRNALDDLALQNYYTVSESCEAAIGQALYMAQQDGFYHSELVECQAK
jgi:uncharacterized protein (DUF1697 family)